MLLLHVGFEQFEELASWMVDMHVCVNCPSVGGRRLGFGSVCCNRQGLEAVWECLAVAS